MKNYVIAAVIGALVLGVGAVYGAQSAVNALYDVKPVLSGEEAVACGAVGGRGAFVFELDKEGNPTSEEAPFCITEVK